MTRPGRHSLLVAVMAACTAMAGCFTGVESTPKITAGEVKRLVPKASAEQRFMSDIAPEAPSQWRPGKAFRVTDNRISLIFAPAAGAGDSLAGRDIMFAAVVPAVSITGNDASDIVFTTAAGDSLRYRVNATAAELTVRPRLDIPFTVERSVVDAAARAMTGRTYYVLTPVRYTTSGAATSGRRYVPVTVTAVSPGNDVFPLAIDFTDSDGATRRLYMTLSEGRTSTRNFDTLFAFTDPRTRHPEISDANWQLIMDSRVANGMTREECRLALGAPYNVVKRPTTAGIVEQWSYGDGVYLMFEDNILVSHRL